MASSGEYVWLCGELAKLTSRRNPQDRAIALRKAHQLLRLFARDHNIEESWADLVLLEFIN